MDRRWAPLLLAALGAAIAPAEASALGQRPAPAADPGAPLVVAGTAETRLPGSAFRAIPRGERLPSHKELRAGDGPLVLRFGDAVVELAPGATLSLEGRLDVVGAVGRRPATKLFLRAGRLAVMVPTGSPDSVLVVSGDNLLLARAGARLSAVTGVRGQRGMFVALDDGDAVYSSTGAWKPLTRGEVRHLATPDTSRTRPVVAAPAWDREEGPAGGGALGVVVAEGARASLHPRVAAVPGASGYVVEVARSETFAEIVARAEVPAPGPVELPPLAPGRYVARARAVDAVGLFGAAGVTRRLRVVRLELPAGSVPMDGAWAVPLGAPVRLDDPSDLEVRHAMAPFEPAPASFSLSDDAPERLVLRLRGDGATLPIVLAPRALQADVELGPKTAVWPDDPIRLRVSVRGPRPAGFEPRLVVRVNRDVVPVAWSRKGDAWTAELAPQKPPGPWVVRVEALDGDGASLGRGFLEVIARPALGARR